MILETSGEIRKVEVHGKDRNEIWSVTADGETFRLRIEPLGRGMFWVQDEGRGDTLHVATEGSMVHVFWRGRTYRLVQGAPGGSLPQTAKPGSIVAPMPGTVIEVKVESGQSVTKGQALVVIEAMKMENVVRAPQDGRVHKVSVCRADRVTPGTVLLEFE